MRLLPKDDDNGWAPYIWLAYFGFFFIHPIADHVRWKEWLATAVATVVFLFLYFSNYWVSGWRKVLVITGLVVMGIAFLARAESSAISLAASSDLRMMTESVCPNTSCRSRAMRSRSATLARCSISSFASLSFLSVRSFCAK